MEKLQAIKISLFFVLYFLLKLPYFISTTECQKASLSTAYLHNHFCKRA